MIARHWTGIVTLNFQAIGYEVFATLSKTKNDMSETKGTKYRNECRCTELKKGEVRHKCNCRLKYQSFSAFLQHEATIRIKAIHN